MFGHPYKGIYIVFEGGEGSGKTTQQQLLVERLKGEYPGRKIVLTREPGGTSKAEEIRAAIFKVAEDGEFTLPLAEMYLFAAARHQNIERTIRPALEAGAVVVADRSFFSSLVYQGMARGLGWQRVWRLNKEAVGEVRPNVVFFLNIDPQIGLARKFRENETNRLDEEKIQFHYQIREGYLYWAARCKDDFLLIDGSLPKERQAEVIWNKVGELMIDRELERELDHSLGRRR